MSGRHRTPAPPGVLPAPGSELAEIDRRLAMVERRATRVRELMHAAEVIALGYDDDEAHIVLNWRPDHFRYMPGVRSTPA